ncbi:MAG: DUF1848 domain-containing protein [Holdemanella sp.]|nr:DUF1848 domain-containing protein [Holdemanella sp.]
MIIQTGQRTDIPAFYSRWFINRLKEGYVLVRNPYNPKQITKYLLNENVVDCFIFCTKNPRNMLPYLAYLKPYKQLWFVTITPYGKDIEPNIVDKRKVFQDFIYLSNTIGKSNVIWRYDPIFINDTYTVDKHIHYFETMVKILYAYTDVVVISFVDLYKKVKRNFPELKEVSAQDKLRLVKAFVCIGKQYNLTIKTCGEGHDFDAYGIDSSGCMSKDVILNVLGPHYKLEKKSSIRPGVCDCFMGNDIGAYDSCMHLCRYCYANTSKEKVMQNYLNHDENSPLLIGHIEDGDVIHQYKQISYEEITLF